MKFELSDLPFLAAAGLIAVLGWLLGDYLALAPIPLIAYGIQWLVFLPSALFESEKFFDLTGSSTYIICVTAALRLLSKEHYARQIINCTLVIVWAVRLGYFLFTRILRDQKDSRFDKIKPHPFQFLNVWTIQGLWVLLTALPVFILCAQPNDQPLGIRDYLGWALWLLGFSMEVVADAQKRAFRANTENKTKFIQSGLWKYSRHPNYFGEITLWTGIFVSCSSVFQGRQWVAAISPAFVAFLLTQVSGVPLLEKSSDKKWGGQPDYQEYKANTSVLVPWFKGNKKVS